MSAEGIHAHPTLKLGRRPHDPARPVLQLADILTGQAPAAPIAVPDTFDDTLGVVYGLDRNDTFGVCVPTGYDNLRRTITRLLAGVQKTATWDVVMAWYRTQNPDFDPATGAGDRGMNIAEFLTYLVKCGEILAFAKVDPHNETELRAAEYLFLALMAGVDLEEAQQAQTSTGRWDYHQSPDWGGHCVVYVASEAGGLDDVITWAERVRTTAAFRARQLSELYVVVRP